MIHKKNNKARQNLEDIAMDSETLGRRAKKLRVTIQLSLLLAVESHSQENRKKTLRSEHLVKPMMPIVWIFC